MEPETLAQQLGPYLLPVLPYLIKGIKLAGNEIVISGGKAIGEHIPDAVKAIWDRLSPKIENSPSAKQAVERAVQRPEDLRVKGALELELEELLCDPSFRSEIEQLFLDAKRGVPDLRIFQSVDTVSGKLTGVRISNGEELQKSGIKSADISQSINTINKSGEVKGFEVGSLDDQE